MIEALAILALLGAILSEEQRRRTSASSLTSDEIDRILSGAQIDGMSGHCAMAAIAINRVFFGGKAKYVLGTNHHLGDEIHPFVGHVAVLWEGNLWDAEGLIGDPEDLRAWGMVDPEDPDWSMYFTDPEQAYDAELVELEPTPEIERMLLKATVAHTSGSSVDEKVTQLQKEKRLGSSTFRHLHREALARSSKLEARSSPVTDEQRRHYDGLVTKLQGWWKKVDPTREGLEESQIRAGLRKLKILDDLVGAGSVRVVLDVGDGALKIATVEGDNWINLEEAKVWDEAPPQIRRWLVPVLAVAGDGSWLLMELADPAPGSLPRGAAEELKEYGIVDIYSYNISSDGRLLDYAHRLEYDR